MGGSAHHECEFCKRTSGPSEAQDANFFYADEVDRQPESCMKNCDMQAENCHQAGYQIHEPIEEEHQYVESNQVGIVQDNYQVVQVS